MADAEKGPGTRKGRADLVGLSVLAAASLAVRFGFQAALLADGAVPLGPDAQDWVLAGQALLEGGGLGGGGDVLEPHRLPLVPWLAAGIAQIGGWSVPSVLSGLSAVASTGLALVTWGLARRFVAPRWAFVPALWVAVNPALVFHGLHTTAYMPFALGFLLFALAMVLPGRRAAWPGFAGALLAAASVSQGLLCLLVAAPAALLARRRWGLAGAVPGAALGLGITRLLHPEARDPVVWMLGETSRYLRGNVAEELATRSGGYLSAWWDWAWSAFEIWPPVLALVVAWALAGQVALNRHGTRDEARAFAGLLWMLLPWGVLVALLASPHHLVHLTPILAATAVTGPARMGLARRRPRMAWVMTAVILGTAVLRWKVVTEELRQAAQVAEGHRDLAEAVEALGGPEPLVLAERPPPDQGVDPVWQARWALPGGGDLPFLEDRPGCHGEQRLREALDDEVPVVLVALPGTGPRWRVGALELGARGTGREGRFSPGAVGRVVWRVGVER